MFIRQTLYCSGVLKLSWAALKYVWEILLPAATWQRNPRMESAAVPFQIGHLWWHEPLYHHRPWQPDLTTRRCQRFLRIRILEGDNIQHNRVYQIQSGKRRSSLVGYSYISDIPKLRPYRIQPGVSKGLQNFELYLKENHAMNQWTVIVSWEFTSQNSLARKKKHAQCIFQALQIRRVKVMEIKLCI